MNPNQITQRLEKVERSNRRLKACVAAFTLVLAFLVLAAATPEYSVYNSLKTRKLEIVNPKGQTVAVLRSDENNCGSLFIKDCYGKNRISVVSYDGGGMGISLSDMSGADRCSINVFDDNCSISFKNSDQVSKSELGVNRHGYGYIKLETNKNKTWSQGKGPAIEIIK